MERTPRIARAARLGQSLTSTAINVVHAAQPIDKGHSFSMDVPKFEPQILTDSPLHMITKQKIQIILVSGLYLLIPGIISWITGRPFIFPSLGPTAYVLAFDVVPDQFHSPRTIIGGHTCGVTGGLLSYHLLVSPNILSGLMEPLSQATGILALGAMIALIITIFLMLLFNASHPPACATTLIISLGILPGLADGLIIIGAVILMYFSYLLVQKWQQ